MLHNEVIELLKNYGFEEEPTDLAAELFRLINPNNGSIVEVRIRKNNGTIQFLLEAGEDDVINEIYYEGFVNDVGDEIIKQIIELNIKLLMTVYEFPLIV